jgi:hypothetical protein
MKKIFLAVILFFISGFICAASLTISVRLPDGKPAKSVRIQAVQLERPGPYSRLLGKTDKKGRIKVEFTDEDQYRKNTGPGVYRFIVMPKNFEWGVSGLYCWAGSKNDPAYSVENKINAAGIKVGPDSALTWEVTLKKGHDAKVRFIDQSEKPIKNCAAGVILDLHARTKDGTGGATGVIATTTKKDGTFLLSNACDAEYTVIIGNNNYYVPGLEYETRAYTAPLKRGINSFIFKNPPGKEITFRVSDHDTHAPLKDALICEEVRAVIPRGGCFGKTNEQGIFYTNEFNSEHVIRFGVTKEGYNEEWLDGDSYTDSGSYSFELVRKE